MYNREELIDICDKAIVPHDEWSNRDTASAQAQVAVAGAYLKAGCDFKVLNDGDTDCGHLVTDDKTIWVEITFSGFGKFEGGDMETDTYYLPTPERLNESANGDWY